jgi:hypothetical protein
MPSTFAQRRHAAGRPLKSPLAIVGNHALPDAGGEAGTAPVARGAGLTERGITLAEFEEYLRTVNNRDGRPYQEKTINAYVAPARNLDAWLTAKGIDGDFDVVDIQLLNRYFREYYLEHGQGGTHTAQRNLIQLFNFLRRERNHPTPYTDGLNRYARQVGGELGQLTERPGGKRALQPGVKVLSGEPAVTAGNPQRVHHAVVMRRNPAVLDVVPAHAGVVRRTGGSPGQGRRRPRTRGGGRCRLPWASGAAWRPARLGPAGTRSYRYTNLRICH